MPLQTIVLSPAIGSASSAVGEVVDAIYSRQGQLSLTVDGTGGITAAALRAVLEPVVLQMGLRGCNHRSFAASELIWEDLQRGIAVSVQAGRAEINNAALLSVLAAAAHRGVDWLLIVLPTRYKSNSVFEKVRVRLESLIGAEGVHLDLAGITLIGF